jgi:hypothetical protein
MKKLLVAAAAAALAMSFAASANAATHKQKVSANVETSCKAQAAKKFSAIHFMKRRNFVNNCVAEHSSARKSAKAKTEVKTDKSNMAAPATTGQATKTPAPGQPAKSQ